MAYDCSLEEERLQKKLIPLNIVVCVLCLVAIISLMFTPLIKIDMSKVDKSALTSMVVPDGSEDSEGSEGSNSEEFDMSFVFNALDFQLSITPIDIAKYAYSDQSLIRPLVTFIVEKTGIINEMIIPMAVESAAEELMKEWGVDTSELDFSEIKEKFTAFNDVSSEEEMRTATDELIDAIARLAGVEELEPADKEEAIKNMVDIYNKTVEVAGDFDLEKMLCVIVSESLELEKPVTNYTDTIFAVLDKTSGEDEEAAGALDTFYELEDTLKIAAKGLFGFIMFTCGVWFVLFLFSLLHIFARNKRFMMWYVKMFGAYPCLLFGVMPTIIVGALKSMGGEMAAVGAILGSIGTLTWISGACYVILWLVSIFWAFPIKRKIRADRKG